MREDNSDRSVRPGVLLVVGVVAAALAAVVFVMESRRSKEQEEAPTEAAAATDRGESPDRAPIAREHDRGPRAASSPQDDPVPYIEGLVYGDVDLREARELMPDNLYWKYGAPTKDEAVLAEREAEKKRRNEEYGRVLSGDAGEDDVKAYFDYRRRLAADYVEFAEFMQRKLRDSANEELRGLMDLALKMNAEKLRQLPAELDDALARSRERAQIREDWRRQQQEFGGLGQPGDAPN